MRQGAGGVRIVFVQSLQNRPYPRRISSPPCRSAATPRLGRTHAGRLPRRRNFLRSRLLLFGTCHESRNIAQPGLELDAHAFPKRDVVLDLRGGGFGFGVIPGSVGIALAVYFHVAIACGSLPWANGMSVARSKELRAHGVGRKILIPFDHHGPVALGERRSVPRGFGHAQPPVATTPQRKDSERTATPHRATAPRNDIRSARPFLALPSDYTCANSPSRWFRPREDKIAGPLCEC